jgi:hypothetical protein
MVKLLFTSFPVTSSFLANLEFGKCSSIVISHVHVYRRVYVVTWLYNRAYLKHHEIYISYVVKSLVQMKG